MSGPASATEDRSLDLYARLVRRVLGVPTALVTFVQPDRQVFAGAAGLPEALDAVRETPLTHSFCQHVVRSGEPLVVVDARDDARVAGNLAIRDLHVIAYAGWPLTDHTGAVLGSLCALDREPRRWTEAELADLGDLAAACSAELAHRALVDELQRSNTQLTAFAAQVSHDLRNPLSALSSSLQLLEEARESDDLRPEVAARLVAKARRSAVRMSELVNSVLAFAVVGGQLSVEDVDVAAVLASVLDDLALVVTSSVVEVGDVAPACADPHQLRIVLQNLLANAFKHADGSPVEVSAARVGDTWTLRVVDHGPGIAAADRRRVLEPFVRLDQRVAGSGLGLATCHRIAEAHGGSLVVTETPGGGTTVLLNLPQPT